MNFFAALFASPIGLTMEEDAYVDAAVDDLLQESSLFARRPSDTVLSLLQEGHRVAPWLPYQVQHPFREHAATQRFLRQYNSLETPSHLSLQDFMLE